MTEKEFQRTVEEFIKRHDLSPTTFGIWALNDSRFVWDLRRGRRCYSITIRKVLAFMAEYGPKIEARRLRQQQEIERALAEAKAAVEKAGRDAREKFVEKAAESATTNKTETTA